MALVFTSHQSGPGSYVGCLLRLEFFFLFCFVLILRFSPLLTTRLERQKENHIRINSTKKVLTSLLLGGVI